MTFTEFETKKLEKIVEPFIERRRPSLHIRNELDLAFRVQEQSVEIFEIHPAWREPDKKIEHPVARATFVKRQGIWKVFWQRADLKWHRYEPNPGVATLDEFLALVEKDQHGCFFG
jgi:hypothetical protein